MRALVLWADRVSPNLGLRALAAGNEALIQRAFPGASVELHNYGAQASPVRVGSVRAALKERVTARGGLVTWLSGFDLVVDTRSGDSFADIYGLERLATMTLMADAVHRAGVPLVMAPQTIGPFESVAGRLLGRRSLRQARVVMTRDSQSAEAAAALGRPVEVAASDVVFALPAPRVPRSRDVVLNISGLLWADNSHVASAGYRETVRRLLSGLLRKDRQVTLLAHVLDSPSPDNDVPPVRLLAREFGDRLETVVPLGLDEVREVVASAQVTIGSRMHACLNSLSVGTPAVPLAYSRKFVPLLEDIGWTYSVDLRASADAVPQVMEFLADPDQLKASATESARRARDFLAPVEDALRAL